MPSTGLLFLPAAKSSGSFLLPSQVFLEMTECLLIVLDSPLLERFCESERHPAVHVVINSHFGFRSVMSMEPAIRTQREVAAGAAACARSGASQAQCRQVVTGTLDPL